MFNHLFEKSRSFGVDLTGNSLKFIELIKTKKGIKVGRFGEEKIPAGSEENFLEFIKNKHKIKNPSFSYSLESKAEALAHLLIKKGDEGAYMIIELSPKEALVFVVFKGKVLSLSSIDIEGVSSADLRDAVIRDFIYWHTVPSESGEEKPKIEKVILCGSGFDLIKLSEYFSVGLKTKTEVADVWANIFETRNTIPAIDFEKSPAFASAIGVALRELKKD